jgi:hypothetical protein
MANPEHLRILQQGVEAWNTWRRQENNIRLDLPETYLPRPRVYLVDLRIWSRITSRIA